jgi:prephenate dehydratase
LRRVYSHPQALAQCERFLRHAERRRDHRDLRHRRSAKLVADEHLEDAAAIASARAGEVFGLTRWPRRFRTSTTT